MTPPRPMREDRRKCVSKCVTVEYGSLPAPALGIPCVVGASDIEAIVEACPAPNVMQMLAHSP